MIRNGHIVINLKIVGIAFALALFVSLVAGVAAASLGFFTYNPTVTSVAPLEQIPSAYIFTTQEVPGEGAIWFGFEAREGKYIMMPDGSVSTYPELGAPYDPGNSTVLERRLRSAAKRGILANTVRQGEPELVAVPQN